MDCTAHAARARWSRVVAVVLACLGCAAPAAAAPVQFGSTLALPANLPFGCESRPYPAAVGATLLQTNATSCMWWQSGVHPASTYVPRGQGTVVGARVKVGANPAPLRISIISSGGGLCCTQQSRSEVFQPAPNAVTTVPLNLPAGSGIDPTRSGGQYNDIVVVTAVGPGSLPVHDTGTHGTFDTALPWAAFLHPELTGGNSNTDVGTMDGYEVLLQVLWCGTAGTGSTATGARAPAASRAQIPADCPAPTVPTVTPAPSPSPAPTPGSSSAPTISARTLTAPVRSGRASVRLSCAGAGCSGSVVLRRAGRSTLLGRKASFTLAAGASRTVKVKLTAAGKAAMRAKRKVAADAVVTFADGTKQTLRVSLKR